ncbi:UNVERIFIED_CONTAM: hypothetical protein PYX00_006046 [Menopon gallinae]|uniref:CYTH domain-containing protein n=1 Tax=Menopon gallinae TaxID=328185 RepID=A0AAW2HTV7_9NEOP
MPRNVEVKAKLRDLDRTVSIVKDLCKSDGIQLIQEDVFFEATKCRLKLRTIQDRTTSQLISYSREDTPGAKISDYKICEVPNREDLLQVLSSSLGIKGIVKKKRQLFLYGQTRIHIDTVEGLGNFLELEVVLQDSQGFSDGNKILQDLLNKLNIEEEDLMVGAYIDLM